MASRGTQRYLRCLDYLEAKYNPEISDEEFNRRATEYMAFDEASRALSKQYMEATPDNDGQEADEVTDDEEEEGEDEYDSDDSFLAPEDDDEEEEESGEEPL